MARARVGLLQTACDTDLGVHCRCNPPTELIGMPLQGREMCLRRNFSSSKLVRMLGSVSGVEVATSSQDVAGQLAQWLNAFDAMALHAAHQSIEAGPAGAAARVLPDAAQAQAAIEALEQEHRQVRATLEKSIQSSGAPQPGSTRPRTGVAALPAAYETGIDYTPYRRAYTEQQRLMDLKIAPLRDHVRQAMAEASPALQQLATLDAALDQMLSARASRLWLAGPQLMARRFEQLRKGGAEPDTWLDDFGREMQQTQLAELDARLQPVLGLIETFSTEVKKNYA